MLEAIFSLVRIAHHHSLSNLIFKEGNLKRNNLMLYFKIVSCGETVDAGGGSSFYVDEGETFVQQWMSFG